MSVALPNPNIYGMIRYSTESFTPTAEEMNEARDRGQFKNAFSAGAVKNPDGSVTYDKKITLGALANNPQLYLKAQNYFAENEKAQKEAEMAKTSYEQETKRQLYSAVIGNEKQYPRFRQEALAKGYFKPEELPEQYDENFLKYERDKNTNKKDFMKSTELDYLMDKANWQKQLGLMNLNQRQDIFEKGINQKQYQFDQNQERFAKELAEKQAWEKYKAEQDAMWKAKEIELKNQQLELQKQNVNSQIKTRDQQVNINKSKAANAGRRASGDITKLAPDERKLVESLSTKTANQIAIKNELDSFISQYDSLNDKEKITQGRALLKTLNSTQGADAIGVEEARRLGSALEFSLVNLNNPNPLQLGYDLKGFGTQVRQTRDKINETIKRNQFEIDKIMKRTTNQNFDQPMNQNTTPQNQNVNPNAKKPSWAK